MNEPKPWQAYNTASTASEPFLLKLRLTPSLWQAYDVATGDEEAHDLFFARYHREPKLIWRDGGCVHAGPITREEHDEKMDRC